MLESIIAKICNFLGDVYGFEYEDLQRSCGLTTAEVTAVREIVEDQE